MSLDTLISLTIDVQDRATEGTNVGTPLIAAYHTAWLSDFVREYSQAKDLLDDGFTANDVPYLIASAIKSQDNAPASFKVGRRATPLTQTVELVPTNTTVGFKYTGTVNGQSFTYTVQTGDDTADITAGLTTVIDALSGVACTDGTTKITITAPAGKVVDIDPGKSLAVADVTADTTLDDDLAAIEAEDDDWYGLVIDTNCKASIALASAFTEARRKICVVQSADAACLDANSTTDVAYLTKNSGYVRTAGIFHNQIGGTAWAAAAWLGGRLTARPGSDTWAFKPLNGVPAVKLTQGQETALQNKNWSHYTRTGGVNITFDGKSGQGRYMDVVRFIDWLYSEIRLAVYSLLINNPKVPFTDSGVDLVRGAILTTLQRGIAAGGLANTPAPIVTAPKVKDVPTNLRASRILPDVSFSATLAGALHGVRISGVVSV